VTGLDVQATVNAADDLERGNVFLTVTGTSAEAGDDGQVGRGNRVSGLITPYRVMTLEAAAGKNPVSHVGNIYNLLAAQIGARAIEQISGLEDVSSVLVSAIGQPVNDPRIVDMALALDGPCGSVWELVQSALDGIDAVRDDLLAERLSLY
jgi:S-adenosylmethionine synthetase